MADLPAPATRPANPRFSSGPCAKIPGYTLDMLGDAPLGRSHRASVGKAKLKQAIDLTREILKVPADYRIGIVPGSDTGAVEMAMWSLLGARKVEMLAWESFGEGWVTDVVKQLKLDAVVGAKAEVSQGPDGKLALKRFGVTCALCHSTVSRDLHVLAGGKTDLAGIVGHRLDGWPNRDLQPGTILSLSPALTPKQAAEYASWARLYGPGFYDPRINVHVDPGSNPALGPDVDANLAAYKAAGGVPVVIPPAFGLVGLGKSTFTGDGDTAHEPAGPVSYWNRYVGVVQMHGHGTFLDERLVIDGKPLSVDHRTGDDRITGILPGLEAYQWSIAAPTLADNGLQWGVASDLDSAAVARGQLLFQGQAQCVACHSGPAFTDVNTFGLHLASASVALDKNYINFSATRQWRTSPLKGIWQHPPYFHDGSGAFNRKTGKCMDGSDIGSLARANDRARQDLACVVNRYNDPRERNLGLTDPQRADLVEYLKSL